MIYDSSPNAGGLFYYPGCGLEPRYPSLWKDCVFASGPLGPSEGSTLRDYSGRTIGAAWSVGAGDVPKYARGSEKGQSFWAGSYDGTNDYADAGAQVTSFLTGVVCSISCWFYATAGNDFFRLASCLRGGPTYNGIEVYFGAVSAALQQTLTIQVGNAGTLNVSRTATKYSLNQWHSVTAIQNGTDRRIWVDGVEPAYGTKDIVLSSFGTGTEWNLGRWPGGATYFFPGSICSHMVHRRILTASEIAVFSSHPIAIYEAVRPRVFFVGGTTFNRRRRLLLAGAY